MVNKRILNNVIDFNKPILVSMENFVSLKEANVISDDGKDLHIPLMKYNMISRNNNFYPDEDVVKSIKGSRFVQENLHNHTLFSECEHPPAGSPLNRFLFIEPTRYAANIRKLYYKTDRLEGDISLCNPLGTSIILPNIKEFGSNYAASCRIYTPHFIEKMNPKTGKKYFVKKHPMYPVTWDIVTMPGIEGCRLLNETNSQDHQMGKTYESATIMGLESCTDVVFDNPGEIIKDMVQSSESFLVLEDYFEDYLKFENINTKNGTLRLSTEDGFKLDVPLNRYIVSEVLR